MKSVFEQGCSLGILCRIESIKEFKCRRPDRKQMQQCKCENLRAHGTVGADLQKGREDSKPTLKN